MATNLSVVMAAFNEKASIKEAVDDIITHIAPHVSTLEIVVVDDGSTDGTGHILDELAAKRTLLRVIHRTNGGHGPALISGLRAASADNLLLLDADRQIDLGDFPEQWGVFQKHDALL